MADWFCFLSCTTKILCLNLDATRHGMTFGQVTNGCLSQITRKIHTDYLVHTPGLLVSQCVRDAQVIERMNSGLLSRATASNSCRENIGLSKLTSGSTLNSKVVERSGILSSFINREKDFV
jgi:hypothetical protein